MHELESAPNPGPKAGKNAGLTVHALDAIPGGDALTSDPFHEGRMHMLRREEIIYLSSHMLNDAQRQEASFKGGKRKSDAEIAEENERLLQHQADEAQLFHSLLAACAAVDMPASRHTGARIPGNGETAQGPRPEYPEPDCLSSAELEKHLAAYTNFVILGGGVRQDAGNGSGSARTSSFVIDSHYGPAGNEDSAEDSPEVGPAWIHVNVPETDPLAPQEPLFPHRFAREGRLSRRARAKTKEAKSKHTKTRPLGRGFGMFLFKLIRLIILGGIIGLGYLILTRQGQG